MALTIRLLGRPRLERDGRTLAGPRGHKTWALLAYLLLCRRPPARQRLADLFFSTADDPLGALRWSLAELRRALGQPAALRGDPVAIALASDTCVDLHVLSSAAVLHEPALDESAGELLEGASFDASPALDAWLLVERRRLGAALEALLRERAQACLTAGRPDLAVRLGERLVEMAPLEEEHQELLVRSLLAAGDRAGAAARVEACDALFRREFEARAPRRLRALLRPPGPADDVPIGGSMAARGQLEAGRAALAAGAVEAGLACLRRACALAERCGDGYLHARAQLALGGALLHTMRQHGEAAAALHRAADVAGRIGATAIAATAHRELALIDVQAGRRERAAAWLARAAAEAADSDEELASIEGVRGMTFSDAARYPEALACLDKSLERARRCGHRRQAALSASLVGRVHLLTGRLPAARAALDRSLELVEEERWIAFEPWPEALLAHLDLLERRDEAAGEKLEHAFTIAAQIGDPCWEGTACRGLGLLDAARGRLPQAGAWLVDARARCTRVANPYQWVHAWILDALCAAAPAHELAGNWLDELDALAARTGMREFVVRAYQHRARRGEDGAREAARALAADIDNPRLEAGPGT